ncbi:MAG: Lrp/AsnC ligand binding domain-containing protein [Pseudomonadota bacterium]
MQCFFVQIKTALGRAYDVADALAQREVASEIYSTSGEYDLMAKFYIEDEADIGHFVNRNLHDIAGIERTFTTLTFKAF